MTSVEFPDGAERAPSAVALSFSARPHLVLLPGRTRWVSTCHENPMECDACLGRVAEFLAREMSFDLDQALERSTADYRADLGEDICSTERAADLRRMTAQVCLPARSNLGYALGLMQPPGRMGLPGRMPPAGTMQPGPAGPMQPGRVESMAAAAEPVRLPREFFCEVEDCWQEFSCAHPQCQAERAEIIPFPGVPAAESSTPLPAPAGWAKWKHWAIGCVLWPALIGLGGLGFAVLALIVLCAAFSGEEL